MPRFSIISSFWVLYFYFLCVDKCHCTCIYRRFSIRSRAIPCCVFRPAKNIRKSWKSTYIDGSCAVYRISLSFIGSQMNRWDSLTKFSVYLQDRSNCHITLLYKFLKDVCSFYRDVLFYTYFLIPYRSSQRQSG